mgnify:CR=1 FL=1
MTGHTPLPWRVEHRPGFEVTTCIVGANGEVVADDERYYPKATKPQDAALIVTAVLVEAALPEGVTAVFGGDPRGAVFRLNTPNYPYSANGLNPKTGYGGADGLYVPPRER